MDAETACIVALEHQAQREWTEFLSRPRVEPGAMVFPDDAIPHQVHGQSQRDPRPPECDGIEVAYEVRWRPLEVALGPEQTRRAERALRPFARDLARALDRDPDDWATCPRAWDGWVSPIEWQLSGDMQFWVPRGWDWPPAPPDQVVGWDDCWDSYLDPREEPFDRYAARMSACRIVERPLGRRWVWFVTTSGEVGADGAEDWQWTGPTLLELDRGERLRAVVQDIASIHGTLAFQRYVRLDRDGRLVSGWDVRSNRVRSGPIPLVDP